MDYTVTINNERNFFEKDFYSICELLRRIRHSLVYRDSVVTNDLNLKGILDYIPRTTQVYVTLFRAGLRPIRWGTRYNTLAGTLDRIVNKLTANPTFKEFNAADSDNCRIMLEYVTERFPVKLPEITDNMFSLARFEPGITGLELILDDFCNYYMPTDAWINGQNDFKSALNTILRRTYIKDKTNKLSERMRILSETPHTLNLIKSRTFITYGERVLPLYRGNILYNYSMEKIKEMALDSLNWFLKYGKKNNELFLYNACEDVDIENDDIIQNRENDNHSDLRIKFGINAFIEAYKLTKDDKYLVPVRNELEKYTQKTIEHSFNGQTAGYILENDTAQLGVTAAALILMMQYRSETSDKNFDSYIEKYARHILSRMTVNGEFMGYYIHPAINDGNPLIEMSDEMLSEVFLYHDSAVALLALAYLANKYDENCELKNEIITRCKIALDKVVEDNSGFYTNIYADLFYDSWLLQAFCETASTPELQDSKYTEFEFKLAQIMTEKMYTAVNTPYIDYEGAFYNKYGDYLYMDGLLTNGLTSFYKLAKKLGEEQISKICLSACKSAAKAQMNLINNEYNSYAHKNPEKSEGAIRFNTTNQLIDSAFLLLIADSYLKLYFAINEG